MKKISVGFLVFNENDNLQQTIRQAYTNLKKFPIILIFGYLIIILTMRHQQLLKI